MSHLFRRNPKADANHVEIAAELRRHGFRVRETRWPSDLLVRHPLTGGLFTVDIKRPDNYPTLTVSQIELAEEGWLFVILQTPADVAQFARDPNWNAALQRMIIETRAREAKRAAKAAARPTRGLKA